MNTCLTIAGSDSSGGAGIQADLKTFQAHGVFGMSVITSITAQNTLGIRSAEPVSAALVGDQLAVVLDDIPPSAIKTGVLANAAIVEVVAKLLSEQKLVPVVIDPVLVSTSGHPLLSPKGLDLVIDQLFPLATLITPNVDELVVIAKQLGVYVPRIDSLDVLEDVGFAVSDVLAKLHCSPPALLCKGGHLVDGASDIFIDQGNAHRLSDARVDNPNVHGTGCTLSAAIAANLANGLSKVESVKNAKNYLHTLICKKLDLGRGIGPLDHTY